MTQPKLTDNQQAILSVLPLLNTKFGPVNAHKVAEHSGLSARTVGANLKPLREKGLIDTNEVKGETVITLVTQEPTKASASPALLHTSTPARTVRDNCTSKGEAPKAIVQHLMVTHNMTKKAAKQLVYDNRG